MTENFFIMFVNKRIIGYCKNLCMRSVTTSSSTGPHISGDSKESYSKDYEMLYDEHIPTSIIQKLLLTVGSSVMSIADPFRHDMIAVLGETTGVYAAKKIHERMLIDPEGSSILREKPRICSETLNFSFLKSLPEGTFGHAYMKFLKDNNVTPDTRQPVHFVDHPEFAYVIQRYREIHDLIHTLLGMPTNMLGEVAVKWVEAIQFKLPMCVAAALLGPIRLRPKQREKYVNAYLPWAIDCGFKSNFLMNVYFEKRWQEDLETLRQELNIPPPPP